MVPQHVIGQSRLAGVGFADPPIPRDDSDAYSIDHFDSPSNDAST